MTRAHRTLGILGFVLILAAGCSKTDNASPNAGKNPGGDANVPPVAPQEITLKTVKYQQLLEALKAEKGTVVVVDVWATYCIPCKKEFPHFIKLHETKANEGVTCISISVDKKQDREKALEYLKAQKATCTNFWLDEEPDFWLKKWDIKLGVPVAFVFDREGKKVRKFDNDDPKAPPFTYEEVNQLVDKLLKEGKKF